MAGIIPGIILGFFAELVVIFYARKLHLPSEPIEWPLIGRPSTRPARALYAHPCPGRALRGHLHAHGSRGCILRLCVGLRHCDGAGKIFQDPPYHPARLDADHRHGLFPPWRGGLFNGILANEYIPQKVAQAITGWSFPFFFFLLIYMMVLLVMGCFVDASGMIGLTVPIIFPACLAMGIDPIALCILIIVNCELGAITPPMGITLYGVSSVTKVPIEIVLRGVVPFFIMVILFMIFLFLLPSVSTWLPANMYKSVFAGGNRPGWRS